VHQVLFDVVRQGLDNLPKLTPYLDRFPKTEPKELAQLCWSGVNWWNRIRRHVDVLAVEKEWSTTVYNYDGEGGLLILTGRPDLVLLQLDNGYLVIPDYKSGWAERNYNHQLMGYLKLAVENLDIEFVGARIFPLYLRSSQEYYVTEVTPAQLDDWWRGLLETLKSDKHHPNPEACLYCPKQYACEARTSLVRQSLALFEENPVAITPEKLAAAYPLYKLASKALKDYYKLLKDAVAEEDGIPLPDGRQLQFKPTEYHSVAASCASFDILYRSFSELGGQGNLDDFADALSIGKSKLEQIIREVAPPRKGAATIRQIMERLEIAGEIKTRVVNKLVLVKGQKEVGNGQEGK